MIAFPQSKINIGLHIVGKRDDGYHNLETLFYPLALNDALEIHPLSPDYPQPEPVLHIEGNAVPGSSGDNTCIKAWRLLRARFPDLPSLQIHLLKRIPSGAGLAGGSSDGTAMLRLLNEHYHLGLITEELTNIALELGSDCPFFLKSTPCIASGRGEKLIPVDVPLNRHQIVLIHPPIHVETGQAFKALNGRFSDPIPMDEWKTLAQQPQEWKARLRNDFEVAIFKKHPELERWKSKLYDSGALYASMTGTGSCIYGIFYPDSSLPDLKTDSSTQVFIINQAP